MPIFRDHLLQFRLTADEDLLIKKAAEQAGYRPGDWARQIVLQAATSLVSSENKTIRLDLSKTGHTTSGSGT